MHPGLKTAILVSSVFIPALAFAAPGGLAEQGAYESGKFADGAFVDAICDIYSLVGGSMGALLTSAALATGLVAAAVGGFNNTRSAVITAVSCFALTSGVSLYFGTFDCGSVASSGTQLPATGGPLGNSTANIARGTGDAVDPFDAVADNF